MNLLNPEVREIFSVLENNGYEVFVVGGAIRDFLLGEKVKDIDLTTNARPEEIEQLFDKTIEVGKHFGTVIVEINSTPFEITTYRKESNYTDKRHPQEVNFSNRVTQDIKRRDFTINALLLDRTGRIIDYSSGIDDLKNRLIRTVGIPSNRFREDQLRKWRAFRLAAEKAFDIEAKTLMAIYNDPDTSCVSYERIRDELTRIMGSRRPDKVSLTLFTSGIFPKLLERIGLDEITDFLPFINRFSLLHKFPKDVNLRFAVILDLLSIDEAHLFLKTLRFSKKDITAVLNYIKATKLLRAESGKEDTRVLLKKAIHIVGRENAHYLLDIVEILSGRSLRGLRAVLTEIIDKNEAIYLSDLCINGNDLLKLGFSGKQIGQILEDLLEQVYRKPELNERETLTGLVKNGEFNIAQDN